MYNLSIELKHMISNKNFTLSDLIINAVRFFFTNMASFFSKVNKLDLYKLNFNKFVLLIEIKLFFLLMIQNLNVLN